MKNKKALNIILCVFIILLSTGGNAVWAQKVVVPEVGKTYLFEIKNGTSRQGKLDSLDATYYYITDQATGPDRVYKEGVSKIKEIRVSAKGFFANPHYSRYLFGPSAIPHPKAEFYWNNLLLEYNTVQYGVTNNFSVGFGGLLFTTLSGNIALTPNFKYSVKLAEKDHVAGGALAFIIRPDKENKVAKAALPFAVYTHGDSESNITAGLGWWVDDENSWAKSPTAYLAGSKRLSRNWMLQGEGFFLTNEENISIFLISARNIRPTSSWDFGALVIKVSDTTIPLPAIGYTLKF
ncbi:MAG: hypothetical protein FJZ78_09460 [Bacteroidetes bacterium]|nr:hypothetical protein [Bacteroidota bacterium]